MQKDRKLLEKSFDYFKKKYPLLFKRNILSSPVGGVGENVVNNNTFQPDPSGNLGFYSSGVEIGYFNNSIGQPSGNQTAVGFCGLTVLGMRNTADLGGISTTSPITFLTINNTTATLGNFMFDGFLAFGTTYSLSLSAFSITVGYATEAQSGTFYTATALSQATVAAGTIYYCTHLFGHFLTPPNSPAMTIKVAWTGTMSSPSHILMNVAVYNMGNPAQVSNASGNVSGTTTW